MSKEYKTVIYDADKLEPSYIANCMNGMTDTGWVVSKMENIVRSSGSQASTKLGLLVVVYEKDIPALNL